MFFGLRITSTLSVDPQLPRSSFLKITNIALDAPTTGRTLLFVKQREQKFLITTLTGQTSHVTVNFCFSERDRVRFLKEGPGCVYLTGLLRKPPKRNFKRSALDMRMDDFFKLQQKIRNGASYRHSRNSHAQHSQTIREILEIDTDIDSEHEHGKDNKQSLVIDKANAMNLLNQSMHVGRPRALKQPKNNTVSRMNNLLGMRSKEKPVQLPSLHAKNQNNLLLCLDSQKNQQTTSFNKQTHQQLEPDIKCRETLPNENQPSTHSKFKTRLTQNVPNTDSRPVEPGKEKHEGLIDQTHKDDFEGMEQELGQDDLQPPATFELSLKSVANEVSPNINLRTLFELSSKRKDRVKKQHQSGKFDKISTAQKSHSNVAKKTRQELLQKKLANPKPANQEHQKPVRNRRARKKAAAPVEPIGSRRTRRSRLRKLRKK